METSFGIISVYAKIGLMNKFTEQEYHEHCDDYNGICMNCHAIRYGDTEPDAENYPCEDCEQDTVFGFEQALIMEIIEVV